MLHPLSHLLSDERFAWLALSSVKGVKHRTWLELSSRYAVQGSQLATQPDSLPLPAEQVGYLKQALHSTDFNAVQRSSSWLSAADNHHLLSIACPEYPSLLRELSSPPLVLFVQGDPSLLSRPQLAIVGTRRPTRSGLDSAFGFAQQLGHLGMGVVSGMALGIDGAAHRGALQTCGSTTAVLGCGVDVVYPKRHHQLYNDILQSGGAVVSEFWPGTPAKAQHFPQRNRIIAGLSLGTLVIEASIRSGTLITANMAIDMGKEVFAVPGNIHNPQTQGCHHLIQQGAKLVWSVEHILEEFPSLQVEPKHLSDMSAKKSLSKSLATDKLLDSVDFDATAVDIIAERNQLPVSEVLAALLEYELRGLIAAVPGGYVKLRGK